MPKKPKSSASRPSRSSEQNTGSPSKRGRQDQTISPVPSMSALMLPLPMRPRSSEFTGVLLSVLSGHAGQPVVHGGDAGEAVVRAGAAVADLDRHAAHAIDCSEAVFV